MEIERIPVEKLNPASYNPRKDLKPGDVVYDKLKRSVEEFGYVEPIVWNRQTGNIVGGHQRYKVLLDLGETELDCVIVDMDEQHERALNVALNKITGEWDYDALSDLFSGLDTELRELTGFGAQEIDGMLTDVDFMDFDGEGDGGGSQIANGDKVRVVIGPLMFDIKDEDHSLYARAKEMSEDEMRRIIMEALMG